MDSEAGARRAPQARGGAAAGERAGGACDSSPGGSSPDAPGGSSPGGSSPGGLLLGAGGRKRARTHSPSAEEPAAALLPSPSLAESVSVIVPVHNGERFLDACLASIEAQSFRGALEVSVFLDGCTDGSRGVCERWGSRVVGLAGRRLSLVLGEGAAALGAGPARNRCVWQSSGRWLCLLDADDVMAPDRVERQLAAARARPHALVGSRFLREPADATERYSRWCNALSPEQLLWQRFRELPLIQPTWFLARELFDAVGGYAEPGSDSACCQGDRVLAEDLDFFYRHLDRVRPEHRLGALHVVDAPLVTYRHSEGSASFRTPRKLLFRIKAAALERQLLTDPGWESFAIWGAGRDGKELFKLLSPACQARVREMYDVDPVKIKQGYSNSQLRTHVPVRHFSAARPPIILCVATDRGGEFERNLASLNLLEGRDYVHFC